MISKACQNPVSISSSSSLPKMKDWYAEDVHMIEDDEGWLNQSTVKVLFRSNEKA